MIAAIYARKSTDQSSVVQRGLEVAMNPLEWAYHTVRWSVAPSHSTAWLAVQTIATILAFGAALRYVVLTSRLLNATAATRETELMLRLMEEYDALRESIEAIEKWYRQAALDGVDPVERFEASFHVADVNYHRRQVSRFFVKIRKLSTAGYLQKRLIVAALSRRAIEDVFLKLVDPLDQVITQRTSGKPSVKDRNFFGELGRMYPRPRKTKSGVPEAVAIEAEHRES